MPWGKPDRYDGRIPAIELGGSKAAAEEKRGDSREQHRKPYQPYIVQPDEFTANGMEPKRGGEDGTAAGVLSEWRGYACTCALSKNVAREKDRGGKDPKQHPGYPVEKKPTWGTGEIHGSNPP